MRKINKIILHCSDSDFGDAALIDKWHRERGFDEIGYHFVILNGERSKNVFADSYDGLIEKGRNVEKQGAHCRGSNRDSIGICLIGKKLFSQKQLMVSLPELILFLMEKFSISINNIFCHSYFNKNKKCPNLDIEIIKVFLQEVS